MIVVGDNCFVEIYNGRGSGVLVAWRKEGHWFVPVRPVIKFLQGDRDSFVSAYVKLSNSTAVLDESLGKSVMQEVSSAFGISPGELVETIDCCSIGLEPEGFLLVPYRPVIHDKGNSYEHDYDRTHILCVPGTDTSWS
jgi:hypothetical protein